MTLPLALAMLVASAAPAADDPARFRSIFQELVETNTVHDGGSCTRAATMVATRLRAAGFADNDLVAFAPDGHPDEGGLVATIAGADLAAGAVLLLGHLDTVPARREDWTRDPFTLTETQGYFVGRGTQDMKGLIAIWVDMLIRLKDEPPHRRSVRMVLTCGEEGAGINGLKWLVANRRPLLRADFALNEGGGGRLTADGRPAALTFQVLEKTYVDFRLTVTNPGGHSSVPRADNAIVQLGTAVGRIAANPFPMRLSDTTRAYFQQLAAKAPPAQAPAMRRIAKAPDDMAARAVLADDPQFNAMLRTTCVVTRIDGGQANNALPQRATANVNCRLLPGDSVAGTLLHLRTAASDPGVAIEPVEDGTQMAIAQPLPTALVDIARRVAGERFPGVPVIPTMSVAASDAPVLIAAGVPTYGVPGIMTDADGGNMHGLDERVRVASLLAGRAYIDRLLQLYLDAR